MVEKNNILIHLRKLKLLLIFELNQFLLLTTPNSTKILHSKSFDILISRMIM